MIWNCIHDGANFEVSNVKIDQRIFKANKIQQSVFAMLLKITTLQP